MKDAKQGSGFSQSEREKRAAEARKRGGRNSPHIGTKVVDIYLPVREYSPDRVRPWEM